MIKNIWRSLDPSKKRYVVIAGGLMTLFVVVSLFSGKPTKNDESRSRQETIRHVITDHNTREIGIDSLSADVKIVTHNNNELRRELESIKQELTKAQTKGSSATEIGREVDRLKQDM
jgi:conjugal transfer pilus assembly protein TraB